MDSEMPPQNPAPSPTGTQRDFANMLNDYLPHKRKKKKAAASFSAWTKIKNGSY